MINMEAPLNLAHQQGRKADMLLKGGKYDEAVACHNRAAEYLLDAMQQTRYAPALESLRLQHAHHLKRSDQLYDRQRRAQILQIKQNKSQHHTQATQTILQGPVVSSHVDQTSSQTFQTSPKQDNSQTSVDSFTSPTNMCDEDSNYRTLTENDSLIGLLIRRRQNMDGDNLSSFHSGVPVERVFQSKSDSNPNEGNKTSKETEELRFLSEDLRKHVQQLLKENEDLKKENSRLKENNKSIFSDVMSCEPEMIPDLPPLEMPQFDFDLLDSQNKKQDEDNDSLLGKSPM